MPDNVRSRPLLRWTAANFLGALLLVGCGATTNNATDSYSTATSSTDPITFQTTTMPVAYLGEAFSSNIAVLGGVGPYGYRVVAGKLPPGITLSGTSLSGTPTTAGAYQFTIEATDANLSTRIKQYTLNVNDLASLSLEPELPTGQVRGETRIPITIKAARKARATRLVWDLGKAVKVTRVQATDPTNALIWSQEGQIVTVDLGFKTLPRSDTRVALITVKPDQPTTLSSSNFWYEARDGQGKLIGGKERPSLASASSDQSSSQQAKSSSASPTTPGSAPVGAAPVQAAPVKTVPSNSSSAAPGTPGQTAPAPSHSTLAPPAIPGKAAPINSAPSDSTLTPPVIPGKTPPTQPVPSNGVNQDGGNK